MYFVGSLLVFGSWIRIVPTNVGYIGWLMALFAWAIRNGRTRSGDPTQCVSKAQEIERLDALRSRNVITDEEFQREKRRLLDLPS